MILMNSFSIADCQARERSVDGAIDGWSRHTIGDGVNVVDPVQPSLHTRDRNHISGVRDAGENALEAG